MAKKDAARTVATRKRIMDAFWGLYCESENVTAVAVARAAQVNRSTFYEYFRDAEDVLEAIEQDIFDYMREKVLAVAQSPDPLDASAIARVILSEKGAYLGVFLGKRQRPSFVKKVKEVLNPLILGTVLFENGDSLSRYEAEFISSGLLAAYAQWFEDGGSVPIEDLAARLREMVSAFSSNRS